MGKASRKKGQKSPKGPQALALKGSLVKLCQNPLFALAILSFIGFLSYSNTFSADFHFDDTSNIVENERIRDLKNFRNFSGSRFIGFLSFAINYHFGKLEVFGYHLVNLVIHIASGFLVYVLLLLLFRASSDHPPSGKDQGLPSILSAWIALAAGLIFVAHPIQTQAVTYIVQRFASLAAFFYILAIVCYLKSRLGGRLRGGSIVWYGLALIATVLAMKTKENTFTLPIVLLIMEGVFFRPISRLRWVSLIPFIMTLAIIPSSVPGALGEGEAGLIRGTTEVSRWEYFLTQTRVIMTYLRLVILPIEQTVDYDYPIFHSLWTPSVLISFSFLTTFFLGAIFLLFRAQSTRHNSRLVSFGILWFFLALSIESSIIPIRDVIFEHRMYLPLAGILIAIAGGVGGGLGQTQWRVRKGVINVGFLVILVVLTFATYERNKIWQNGLTLWGDGVRKAPNKPRPHHNFGSSLLARGFQKEALEEFKTTLDLDPEYAMAHLNIGKIYKDQRRYTEAVEEYNMALELEPKVAQIHSNLGNALRHLGRLPEAIQEYKTALELGPELAGVHNNLGNAYKQGGRTVEAIKEYKKAIELQSDLAQPHFNLGDIYQKQGSFKKAAQYYRRALEIRPDYSYAKKALKSLPTTKPLKEDPLGLIE